MDNVAALILAMSHDATEYAALIPLPHSFDFRVA